jgi:hypothetical protein
MAVRRQGRLVLRHIETLFNVESIGHLTDGQLNGRTLLIPERNTRSCSVFSWRRSLHATPYHSSNKKSGANPHSLAGVGPEASLATPRAVIRPTALAI